MILAFQYFYLAATVLNQRFGHYPKILSLLGFWTYAKQSCPEAFLTTSEGDDELLIPMALHP